MRTLGAIGVVETHDAVPVAALQEIFVEAGVWIRPFTNLIYLMPPFVIDSDDLHQLTTAIGTALEHLVNSADTLRSSDTRSNRIPCSHVYLHL